MDLRLDRPVQDQIDAAQKQVAQSRSSSTTSTTRSSGTQTGTRQQTTGSTRMNLPPVQSGDANFQQQLAAFMGSIKAQESGGDISAVSPQGAQGLYQIMPSNWPSWAEQYGLGRNAPMTRENQEYVTQRKMTDYFRDYGSWDAVAVAWFAGPDRARRYVQGDRSVQGIKDGLGTTVSGYVSKAINTLSKNLGYTPESAYVGGARPAGVDAPMPTNTVDGFRNQFLGPGADFQQIDPATGQISPGGAPNPMLSLARAPRAENYLRGAIGGQPQDRNQQVLAALGGAAIPFAASASVAPQAGLTGSTGSAFGPSSAQAPSSDGVQTMSSAGTVSRRIGTGTDTPPSQAFAAPGPQAPQSPDSPSLLTVSSAGTVEPSGAVSQDAAAALGRAPFVGDNDMVQDLLGVPGTATPEDAMPEPDAGGDGGEGGDAPAPTGGVTGLPTGLGLDPLLGLADSLTESTGGLLGIGGDLSQIVDPALMAALGELGLNEDLGTRSALDSGVRLLLEGAEQRRRLERGFQREQELTGANASARGLRIFSPDGSNEEGLIGGIGRALGEQQGQSLGDFNADVGDRFRGLLSGLGNEALGNVAGIGNELIGAIGRNLNRGLDQQAETQIVGG